MRYAVVALTVACWIATLPAQTPSVLPVAEARFDVVSVRPLPPGVGHGGYRPEPGRFDGQMNVIGLLMLAYQVQQFRIIDAPGWARSEYFQIDATISTPRQRGDLAFMVRHLLEERFGLKVRRERRPLSVYVLVMARADGRLGPRLQRVKRDCAAPAASPAGCSAVPGLGLYRRTGEPWERFVSYLQEPILGRPVVDKTGLSGQFDITLEWNPEISRIPDGLVDAPALTELEARPILPTALQEQLGLKLESGKEMVEVLVVEGLTRPTPN